MLDIDTLNSFKDLMARTLYSAEVKRLPTFSRAQEQEVIARARRHDPVARALLIGSCLSYALTVAVTMFLAYRLVHEEVLDLAQTASEAMLKALDNALAKKANPASYLRAVAKRSIAIHVLYHADLIRKPNYRRAELATMHIPAVESLDAPAFRESHTLKIDLVEAPPHPAEEPTERFAPLYEALSTLTARERNSIAARYHVGEIDPTTRVYNTVDPHTLTKLRKALEPRFKQMLE